MIEPREKAKPKPPRPALASRILAVGASAAATIGLVGAMVARAPAPSSTRSAVTSASSRPLRIVVVIKRPRSAAPLSVTRAPSASRSPRVIRRYVAAPATTTTHAS